MFVNSHVQYEDVDDEKINFFKKMYKMEIFFLSQQKKKLDEY
jgi:hypothetical protein